MSDDHNDDDENDDFAWNIKKDDIGQVLILFRCAFKYSVPIDLSHCA